MRFQLALVVLHAVSSAALGISIFSASQRHVPAVFFPLIVLLSECLKLVAFCILGNLCTLINNTASHTHKIIPEYSCEQLSRPPGTASELHQPRPAGKDKAAATSSWTSAALAACIPAVCYTVANNLALNALWLISHAYTCSLLWCLSIVSTGLCSRWCLQPRTAACRTAAKGGSPQPMRGSSPVDAATTAGAVRLPPTYKTLAILLAAVLVGFWAADKAVSPAQQQQQQPQQLYSNVRAALMMVGVAVLTSAAQFSMLLPSGSSSRSAAAGQNLGVNNMWLHARIAGGSIACSIIWLLWQHQQRQQQHNGHTSSGSDEASNLLHNSNSSNQRSQATFWQAAVALAVMGSAAAALQQQQQQQASSTITCAGSIHASGAAASAASMPSIPIMYAIALAVPLTSIGSSVLLEDRPPLLFLAAAAVSFAMVVVYHYTCSPLLQKLVIRVDKAVGDCGGWRRTLFRIWKAAFVLKIAVLLLLPLYMASGGSSSSSGSGSHLTHISDWLHNSSSNSGGGVIGRSSISLDRLPGLVSKQSFPNGSVLQDNNGTSGQATVYQVAGFTPQTLTAVTNTRFPADLLALPEPPQQQQQQLQRLKELCPAVDCVSNATCSVDDPRCCAYYNVRLLAFLDSFLQGQGLTGQYCAVYGTLLAAVNQSWFSRLSAPDIGVSTSALQVLQQPKVRRTLWRHGYVLLSSITAGYGDSNSDGSSFSSIGSSFGSSDRSSSTDGSSHSSSSSSSNSSSSSSSGSGSGSQGLRVWRLCAHGGHPSHRWRRRFRTAQQQRKQDKAALAAATQAFALLHLMWPANTTTTTSSSRSKAVGSSAVGSSAVGSSAVGSSAVGSSAVGSSSSSGSSSPVGSSWLSIPTKGAAASSGAAIGNAAGPSAASAGGVPQWQLCLSDVVLLSSGSYGVNLSGLVFPAPDNTGALLSSAYGNWQQLLEQQQPDQQQGQGSAATAGLPGKAAEVELHKAIAAAAAGQKLGGGVVIAPLVRREYARDACVQKTWELLAAMNDTTGGSSSSSALADSGAGSSMADGTGSEPGEDSRIPPSTSSSASMGTMDDTSSGDSSGSSSSSDTGSSDAGSSAGNEAGNAVDSSSTGSATG